jgi:hypothetical protein
MKTYLSVCAMFKWEWPWLGEWLNYHCSVGVERFYLVGNEDGVAAERSRAVLRPYIDRGVVNLQFASGKGIQKTVFNSVLLPKVRGASRWAAFIDVDEFLVPLQNRYLSELLPMYERFPALAVNWWMFGSSGLTERPLSIRAFNRKNRLPDAHVKLIVNPALVEQFGNAHFARYSGDQAAVNENCSRVMSHESTPPSVNRVRINHYLVRSREDFYHVKIPRGQAGNANHMRSESMWHHSEANDNDVFDDSINRLFEPGAQTNERESSQPDH